MSAFLTQNCFLYLVQELFYQKSDLLPFFHKIDIFGRIWYQKWILWLISILKMYTFIYITVIVYKLWHSLFFTISGLYRKSMCLLWPSLGTSLLKINHPVRGFQGTQDLFFMHFTSFACTFFTIILSNCLTINTLLLTQKKFKSTHRFHAN